MKKLISLGLLGTALISFAGGYKIPEQSLRSTATSGAYFSSANAPDASYYNPANMSFMKDGWGVEVGMRYIVLPNVDFSGSVYDRATNGFLPSQSFSSEKDSFFVPYFHYVSPKVGKLRFGLSFTTPAGLSKRWENSPAQGYAKNFLLEVYETSLSVSYLVMKNLSVGGGLRAVYAKGEVELAHPQNAYAISMDGSTDIKPAYFISVSFKPIENLTLSTLYRSKVDLKVDGDASGYIVTSRTPLRIYNFDTSGNVEVPLPAEWRLGASYKLGSTTFEFTYERTFWSSYERLNFNFADATVEGAFGRPQPKDWEDTNTYRFALYHTFSKSFTAMAGVAYDESPVPERTLGFELPDSDGWIFSAGGLFKPDPKVELGVAYLYFMKEDRSVQNDRIRGEFKDISAHMLTLSLGYSF